MTTGCYETSFLLFANAGGGGGGGETINCQMPGPRDSSCNTELPGVCPEVMLAAGFDSHIIIYSRIWSPLLNVDFI